MGNYSVDGFCQSTNTVYEYYGCYHHGHCGDNKDPKKWQRTKVREKELSNLGYKIHAITSCQWKKNPAWKKVYPVTQTPCKFSDIKNAIISGESFGFVKCDIHVPEGPFKNDVTAKMRFFDPPPSLVTICHYFWFTPSLPCHRGKR